VRERAALLGIRRYVQTHTIESPLNEELRASRGGPEAYDGVAGVWFDSAEALSETFLKPEAQQAALELLEDERKFIDLERSPIFLAQGFGFVG
jgi:hypothetical protein